LGIPLLEVYPTSVTARAEMIWQIRSLDFVKFWLRPFALSPSKTQPYDMVYMAPCNCSAVVLVD
jgi:hypothetical protein